MVPHFADGPGGAREVKETRIATLVVQTGLGVGTVRVLEAFDVQAVFVRIAGVTGWNTRGGGWSSGTRRLCRTGSGSGTGRRISHSGTRGYRDIRHRSDNRLREK